MITATGNFMLNLLKINKLKSNSNEDTNVLGVSTHAANFTVKNYSTYSCCNNLSNSNTAINEIQKMQTIVQNLAKDVSNSMIGYEKQDWIGTRIISFYLI